jgi:CheY-like chemotaxis protein
LLRAASLPRPVYAIAMSGFGMTADRAKSFAAGYRHHILKPFDPGVLDAILEEAARELEKPPAPGDIDTHLRE